MASKPEKLSLEQLIRVVTQLPAEEREKLRIKLNSMAETSSVVAEAHPFLDRHINIDDLAAHQGVPDSTSVEGLKGDFWPEDEDLSEFVTTIRKWRQQSSKRE
jgi:hypothetical protein